jgi:hypothetical protein
MKNKGTVRGYFRGFPVAGRDLDGMAFASGQVVQKSIVARVEADEQNFGSGGSGCPFAGLNFPVPLNGLSPAGKRTQLASQEVPAGNAFSSS